MTDARAGWAALASFCAALAALAFTTHRWFDPSTDGALFVACARSLLAGDGYAYLGEPFLVRPPGFSLLLAPVLALRGTDFLASNLLTGAFGAAAVALYARWAAPRMGVPLALLAALALWSNPGFQHACNQPLSDVPGLALLFACLLLERRADGRPSLARQALLGVAIGLSAWMRTALILLVPAIVLSRLLVRARTSSARREPRRALLRRIVPFAAVAVACVLPWSARNARLAPAGPSDQTHLASYGAGMWHVDPGDPASPRVSWAAIASRLPERARDVTRALGSRLSVEVPDRGRMLLQVEASESPAPPAPREAQEPGPRPSEIVWTLALAAGLLRAAWKHAGSAELWCLLLLGVVLVYFGFDTRLMLPVFAIGFAGLAELARDAVARVVRAARPSRANGPAPARIGALVAGSALLALSAADADPRRDWDLIERRHKEYRRIAEIVQRHAGADEVLATAAGGAFEVFLDRPVFNLRYAVRRAGDVRAVEEVLAKHDIDVVFLCDRVPIDRNLARHFDAHHALLAREGGVSLYRVR